MSSVKGVIPYETLARYDLLDIASDNDTFFLSHHFYPSLKDTIFSREDYKAIKKLHCTMNLENLGELNYIIFNTP